jgi:chorismate mutase/prephenate dehydratase
MDCFKEIDQQLVSLVDKRIKLMKEEHILAGFSESYIAELTINHEVPKEVISNLLNEISNEASKAYTTPTVAFLGTSGSFTNQAALKYFGKNATYKAVSEISEIFKLVESAELKYGIIPVENSTEGAVKRTLDSLIDSKTQVVGEVRLEIKQNLLSNIPMEQIENVYSHPQALAQCHNWLRQHLPHARLIESENTTEGVKDAVANERSAAIASLLVAEHQPIKLLKKNIQDQKDNATRFLVISRYKNKPTGHDKTSLLVCTKHMPGALYHALAPFAKYEASLAMIESRPSKRLSWEYFFFIDFIGHIDEKNNKKMIEELSEHCQFVKILGSYPRA